MKSNSHRLLLSASLMAATTLLTGCGDGNKSSGTSASGGVQVAGSTTSEQLSNANKQLSTLQSQKGASAEQVQKMQQLIAQLELKKDKEAAAKLETERKKIADELKRKPNATPEDTALLQAIDAGVKTIQTQYNTERDKVTKISATEGTNYDGMMYKTAQDEKATLDTAIARKAEVPAAEYYDPSIATLEDLAKKLPATNETDTQRQAALLVADWRNQLNVYNTHRQAYNDQLKALQASQKEYTNRITKLTTDAETAITGTSKAATQSGMMSKILDENNPLQARHTNVSTNAAADGFEHFMKAFEQQTREQGGTGFDANTLIKPGKRQEIAKAMVKSLHVTAPGGLRTTAGVRNEGFLSPLTIEQTAAKQNVKITPQTGAAKTVHYLELDTPTATLGTAVEGQLRSKSYQHVGTDGKILPASDSSTARKAIKVAKNIRGTLKVGSAANNWKLAFNDLGSVAPGESGDVVAGGGVEIQTLDKTTGTRIKVARSDDLRTTADWADPTGGAGGAAARGKALIMVGEAIFDIASKSIDTGNPGAAEKVLARVDALTDGMTVAGTAVATLMSNATLTNALAADDTAALNKQGKIPGLDTAKPPKLNALKAALEVGKASVLGAAAPLPAWATTANGPNGWANTNNIAVNNPANLDTGNAVAGWAGDILRAVTLDNPAVALAGNSYSIPDVMIKDARNEYTAQDLVRWSLMSADDDITKWSDEAKEVYAAIDNYLQGLAPFDKFWVEPSSPTPLALSAGFMNATPHDLKSGSLRGMRTGLRTGFDASQFTLNGVQGDTLRFDGPVSVQLNGSISEGKATAGTSMTATYRMGNTLIGAIQSYANEGNGFEDAASQSETSVVASHSFGPYFVEAQLGAVAADNVHESNWSGARTQFTVGLDSTFVSPFIQASYRNLTRDATYTLDHSNVALGLEMDLGELHTDSYIFENRLTAKVGYGEKHWSKDNRSNGLQGATASIEWSASLSLNSGVGFSTNLTLDSTTGSAAGFNLSLDR